VTEEDLAEVQSEVDAAYHYLYRSDDRKQVFDRFEGLLRVTNRLFEEVKRLRRNQ
jgi:hypothetical protein